MPARNDVTDDEIRRALRRLGSQAAVRRQLGCGFSRMQRIAREARAEAKADPDRAPGTGPLLDGRTVEAAVAAAMAQLSRLEARLDAQDARPATPAPGAGQTPATTAPAPWPARGCLHTPDRDYRRVAFVTDVHCPFHDPRAVGVALERLAAWGPDLVVLGGDQFDHYSISRYDKSPARREAVQDEYDAGQPIWRDVDSLGGDVAWITGNHDARIQGMISANPGLHGLRCLDVSRAAELPARWRVLPDQAMIDLGPALLLHGNVNGGPRSFNPGMMLRFLRRSCVFGHFHQAGMAADRELDGTPLFAFGSGHLGDAARSAEYATAPRWQQGFVEVEVDRAAGMAAITPRMIRAGRLVADGRTYEAPGAI